MVGDVATFCRYELWLKGGDAALAHFGWLRRASHEADV
jgi:hypothetical protein